MAFTRQNYVHCVQKKNSFTVTTANLNKISHKHTHKVTSVQAILYLCVKIIIIIEMSNFK